MDLSDNGPVFSALDAMMLQGRYPLRKNVARHVLHLNFPPFSIVTHKFLYSIHE